MTVAVTSSAQASRIESLRGELEALLKEKLGVKIAVEVVAPGALDADTEIHSSPKPKRFRDERSLPTQHHPAG